jgi:hypothetical protein
MSPIIDLGYTGSNFSVEREFTNEPRKSYCQDTNKIIELKNKLIQEGFVDKGSTLLNQNGNFHYLYVF